jgi:hypothetical protein
MVGMKWSSMSSITCRLTACGMAALVVGSAGAQSEVHGRGWKPLPPTAHIVVTVVKGFNGKPLSNAAVVFHAVRNGKNDGNLEVKTNEEGQAAIDVIEIGSHLTVQVIANGFATSATEMNVDGASKELEVKMIRPRAQISVYENESGQASHEKPGIQEPGHPILPTPAPAKPAAEPTKPMAVPPPAGTPPALSLEARLSPLAGMFQQVPATPPGTVPAVDAPVVMKDAAATTPVAAPETTERPSATPLAAPPTSTAPVVKALRTPGVEAPSEAPRRVAPTSLVVGTASPLTVAAPTARAMTTRQVVTAPTMTQRGGPRVAPTNDAAPLAVTQRAAERPSATPVEATQFQSAPPATAPSAAAPTVIALPKNAPAVAPATPPVGLQR